MVLTNQLGGGNNGPRSSSYFRFVPLSEAGVIQQFLHLVSLVASAFPIAIGPVALVWSGETLHTTIDRGVGENRPQSFVADYAFAVVADQNVASARRREQSAERIRSITS